MTASIEQPLTVTGAAPRGGDRRRTVAAVAWGLSVAAVVADLALFAVDVTEPLGRTGSDVAPRLFFPIIGGAFATVGALIVARLWTNVIGRLFTGVGLAVTVGGLVWEYGIRATRVHPGSLPAGDWTYWVGSWLPFVMIPAIPLLLAAFPEGRWPGRRWKVLWWLAIAGVPLFLLGDLNSHRPAALTAPGPGRSLLDFLNGDAFGGIAALVFAVSMLGALVAMGLRIKRADSVQRHQLKWLALACLLVIAVLAYSAVRPSVGPQNSLVDAAFGFLFLFAFTSVPAAVGVAILRYRLYDIDVVLSRALAYGALAAFITTVYVGIVVGVGTLVGGAGRPNLVLSIIATAIVAVAFQPVRERLQRIANRLVYGKRATPYEVLAQFSTSVAESYAGEQVLARMAQVLADGTGARLAGVWLRGGNALRLVASWPDSADSDHPEAVELTGQLLPAIPGADRTVPVRHQGELLGALTINKRSGESLTPIEEKLLDDLAHQAGLVLKNVGLTADLQARLKDLRASRQRLVAAQDQERRRLERNLHDGAQQHLVAIKVKLGLVEMLAVKDPARAKATLNQLKADTDEALETLRDLARGIYPPLLADKGLSAALEAQARKATLPVVVEAAGVQRYPQEVEAAVYFCILEALQNVQKYAGATSATIALGESVGGELNFEVRDDGAGFDVASTPRGSGLQNLEDRLSALGGVVGVDSTPGSGTRVHGRLPVGVPAAV
ncbi:MAG: histidine kinase [Candidatus Dormibacteria bacterium]